MQNLGHWNGQEFRPGDLVGGAQMHTRPFADETALVRETVFLFDDGHVAERLNVAMCQRSTVT